MHGTLNNTAKKPHPTPIMFSEPFHRVFRQIPTCFHFRTIFLAQEIEIKQNYRMGLIS